MWVEFSMYKVYKVQCYAEIEQTQRKEMAEREGRHCKLRPLILWIL